MSLATNTVLPLPALRVALYARYSSDNQRDASIEDQLRQCRERAAREGWAIVESYSDRAISGASLIRSGIQSVLADAQAGRFDILLSEALDRISRDQEDVAAVFKCLRFAGVTIATLSEGEISELHVGLKGTMNALFLKDLAMKTHRGIRGRVEAGTRDGGRWGLSQIHAILTRTTYIGEHRFNTRSHKTREKKADSEVSIMAVPPLIDRETFDAVQARLKSRDPMVTPARISSGPTLLPQLRRPHSSRRSRRPPRGVGVRADASCPRFQLRHHRQHGLVSLTGTEQVIFEHLSWARC